MTTDPTRVPDPDEIPEADRIEQQQSAGFVEDRVLAPGGTDRALPDGADGDLAEQAQEVPLDDEER